MFRNCGLTLIAPSTIFDSSCFAMTISLASQILDAMNQDSELPLAQLKVDGGMAVNDLVLQLQTDILGIPVGMTT